METCLRILIPLNNCDGGCKQLTTKRKLNTICDVRVSFPFYLGVCVGDVILYDVKIPQPTAVFLERNPLTYSKACVYVLER